MAALTSGAYAFSPYALPVALTAVLILAFGASVLAVRKTGVGKAFFTATLVVAMWMGAFTALYSSREASVALLWARLAYLGVPFIAPALYWFTVELLRIDRERRLALILSWSGAAFFSSLALTTDHLISGVHRYWWGFYPRYGAGVGAAFLAFFFGFLILSLVELIRAYPEARGMERERIRQMIVGFGIAYVGCVDFLPKYGIAVYPVGYVAILGFVVVVTRAMRKYDLVAITPSLAAPEIIDTMADALFVCDSEGRIQFANRAATALLGWTEEELCGRKIDELLAQEGELGTKLKRRSLRNSEYVFASKGGDRVDITLSIAPVMHDGVAAGAVLIGRDIRDRKRAEREVLQAVTLMQSTLDSTADGILVIADDGRIVSYNQRFLEMWSIPVEVMESAGRGAIQRVVDQVSDPDEFMRTIDNLASTPEAESFDLLELKDARRFERYSIGRRVADVFNIRVWSFRDVTARFAAEAALRESEVRYRLLFEQNAAGVCVTDVAGAIVDCNVTFATMLGYQRSDLIGHRMNGLYARSDECDELALLMSSAGTLNSVEVELRRADGSPLWVLENLVLVGAGLSGVMHATVVDISDRKRAEEQIEFHAYHDVLTHLPNRKLFADRLRHAVTRSRRTGRAVAVMFIDIDRFKTINDTLGHTAGDELLLEMARRLRDCVREDDTVARLGGDEFTIILAELARPEDAIGVAQKILETVQIPLSLGSATPIVVTASIGISLYPVDGVDPEALLRNADSAMYRAKEAGRNTYVLCTDEMKTRAMERLAVESRLRAALHDGQMIIAYQPQISLLTGRTIGVEALVRWNDPERGIVNPEAFIPIAEESRLIIPLGEWVLRTACQQLKVWHEQGSGPVRVAVNLSARQFQQHDLVDIVRTALKDARLEPSALELEITETTAMQNAEMTVDVMRALRAIGVGISIDDFGMGYSSLNYLKRFPITAVKIDRAFVQDLAADEGDAAIVSAVIGMARSLRLRVIAEGVETAEQFAFLRSKSCDEAQGFYFSRPVAPEEISRMLLDRRMLAARGPRVVV